MTIPTDYVSGTITLTNGSTSFSGVGTSWLAADFREGDLIIWIDGGEDFSSPIIQQILTNTSGTLISEWVGPTLTNAAYRMRYQWDSSRVSAQSRQLVEQLGNGNITSFSGLEGPGVPVFNGPHSLVIKPEQDFINGIAYNVQVDELSDRDAYDGQIEGFSVLVSDNGDGRAALYSKVSNASGDWTAPAYITGPIGAQSIIEATVSSLPTGSEPEVNVTPITGGYNLAFELPEAEGFYWASEYSASETYPLSSVVRYNRSSFIAIQNVPINESPSNAFPPVDNSFWEVLAQGGANGTGTIVEIENGNGILIDDSDPTSPIISLDAALGDLKDIDLTTNPPEDGQTIIWDETEEKWVPGEGGGTITELENGNGISIDATDPTTPIISLDAALGDLKDVDLTTNPPENGQSIVWNETEEKWIPGEGGGEYGHPLFHAIDAKTAGTAGGGNVVGVQTRTLNTVLTNEITGATLSSNVVSLPEGVYWLEASAPSFSTTRHQLRIQNSATSAVLMYGTGQYTTGNATSTSMVSGRLVVPAGGQTIRLSHYTQSAKAGDGLGVEVNDGTEVYAVLKIWRLR